MKLAFAIFFLILALSSAKAQSPWFYGSGSANNLENAIQYKNGVKAITGSLDPQVTPVNAPAGSTYQSTTGALFIKLDAGSTANWLKVVSAPEVLDDLIDVSLASPASGEALVYNGVNWVNQPLSTVSADRGVVLFPTDTTEAADYGRLPSAPLGLSSDTNNIVLNNETVFSAGFITPFTIDNTVISGGSWQFNFYVFVSTATGTTTLGYDVFKAVVGAGTLTVTGSGTSRTCTSSAPMFVTGDANANPRLAGYIQGGVETFQITAFTDSQNVTCQTTNGYVNESGVAYTLHRLLFGRNTLDINNTSVALRQTISVQPSFSVNATDKIAVRIYGTSDTSVTLSYVLDGTESTSHILTTLSGKHNDLEGLQGGNSTERFHLSLSEATVATQPATGAQNGFLTSTDWTTFNNKLSGPGSSTDGEIVLFDGATGNLIKSATGSGFVKSTSGVYSTQVGVNLASDVSGILPMANGGSSKALTPAAGSVVYTDADSMEVSPPGTDGYVFFSRGPGFAPQFDPISGAKQTVTFFNASGSATFGINRVDASAGNITLALPSILGDAGRVIIIKKIDSSVNTVTIDGDGPEPVEGSLTFVLYDQNSSVTLVSNDVGGWEIY